MTPREPLEIGGSEVAPGSNTRIDLAISRLIEGTPVSLPIQVFHGSHHGATVWLSGAIHGDELCGIEIIRRVCDGLEPSEMHGTVLAAPIVNVFGFTTGDRYLPDRRDLNRSFPGSARGSLAARIAQLFMSEVVERCSVGIDFHTGSDHRVNWPQVRGDLEDDETRRLATVFAAPIAIHSKVRSGSLRHAVRSRGKNVLVFEGGEAHRIDPHAVEVGTAGTRRVLASLSIIEAAEPAPETMLSMRSRWIRAPRSGIVHLEAALGDRLSAGATIGTVYDPFGVRIGVMRARDGGIVIGHRQHPLVHQGDAVAHIAAVS